jgi:hypothetical protein
MAPSMTLDAGQLSHPRPGPDPLPTAYTARWPLAPQIDRVRFGAIRALRYGATLAGGLSVERTYVVPTTKGYIAISCRAPVDALARLDHACDAIAATLRLRDATPLALGSSATAQAVGTVLARLDAARTSAARGLSSTSRVARAAAARTLAAAHARAARKLSAVPAGPLDGGALHDLREGLTMISANLATLATAVSADQTRRYRLSRTRVAAGDRAIARALSQLRAAGYRITSYRSSTDRPSSNPGSQASDER